MRESYGEGLASRTDRESCVDRRTAGHEAVAPRTHRSLHPPLWGPFGPSLLAQLSQPLNLHSLPSPDADPHVRSCGRGRDSLPYADPLRDCDNAERSAIAS